MFISTVVKNSVRILQENKSDKKNAKKMQKKCKKNAKKNVFTY